MFPICICDLICFVSSDYFAVFFGVTSMYLYQNVVPFGVNPKLVSLWPPGMLSHRTHHLEQFWKVIKILLQLWIPITAYLMTSLSKTPTYSLFQLWHMVVTKTRWLPFYMALYFCQSSNFVEQSWLPCPTVVDTTASKIYLKQKS
jgi:hypothetical protein